MTIALYAVAGIFCFLALFAVCSVFQQYSDAKRKGEELDSGDAREVWGLMLEAAKVAAAFLALAHWW